MKQQRMDDASYVLSMLPHRGSYLDVACGLGAMLRKAEELQFSPVQGTEIVPQLIDGRRVLYAECHNLPFPDASFDVVSLFDVIEHLLPPDDEAVCKEMARVARKHVLIMANNGSSKRGGDELHVNIRPFGEWDRLFRQWFSGTVTQLPTVHQTAHVSIPWRIDLAA